MSVDVKRFDVHQKLCEDENRGRIFRSTRYFGVFDRPEVFHLFGSLSGYRISDLENVCIWRRLSFVAKVHFECVRQSEAHFRCRVLSLSLSLGFGWALLIHTIASSFIYASIVEGVCVHVSCCGRFLIENTEHEKCAQAKRLTSVSQLNENNSHKMAIRNGCLCPCVCQPHMCFARAAALQSAIKCGCRIYWTLSV